MARGRKAEWKGFESKRRAAISAARVKIGPISDILSFKANRRGQVMAVLRPVDLGRLPLLDPEDSRAWRNPVEKVFHGADFLRVEVQGAGEELAAWASRLRVHRDSGGEAERREDGRHHVCIHHLPGHDFTKELVLPGTLDGKHRKGVVGVRVDDDFWVVATLPWRFRGLSIQDICAVLWPGIEPIHFEADGTAEKRQIEPKKHPARRVQPHLPLRRTP